MAKPAPSFEEFVRMRVVQPRRQDSPPRVRRDFVYKVAGTTELTMDVYLPAAAVGRPPVVVMIHGGPVPPGKNAKNMGIFLSYGELLADAGLAAVTFGHRFVSPESLEDAGADVEEAVRQVRSNAEAFGLDADRMALWAFSGGGPFLSVALRRPAPYVRALVAYYAALDLQQPAPGSTARIGDDTRRAYSPLFHVSEALGPLPSMLVARAGQDHPFLNATIERFVQAALAKNVDLDVLNHPAGRHGFDILDDDDRSREIIGRTLEFLRARLRA
jgi:acetyl esterase/lipase